jgi:hypothetical protein
MVRTVNDTRRVSLAAKRQHGITQATQHGWSHSALPLQVSLEDILRTKAARDDELGDMADAVLMAAGRQ